MESHAQTRWKNVDIREANKTTFPELLVLYHNHLSENLPVQDHRSLTTKGSITRGADDGSVGVFLAGSVCKPFSALLSLLEGLLTGLFEETVREPFSTLKDLLAGVLAGRLVSCFQRCGPAALVVFTVDLPFPLLTIISSAWRLPFSVSLTVPSLTTFSIDYCFLALTKLLSCAIR